MSYWLLKTEPSEYSFADLVRDRRATWDGVTNATALMHMRRVARDDLAFVYHTGNEKQIVGVAEIIGPARPDPDADSDRIVVFDIRPRQAMPTPVTLAQIKADPRFKEFDLVRISRLAVMPVPPALWRAILKMGGAA